MIIVDPCFIKTSLSSNMNSFMDTTRSCSKSMCMTMIDKKYHDEANKLFDNLNRNSETKFQKFSKLKGSNFPVKFGEALIFSTDNFHYIPINETNKTRWSLNIRFKNLFTPYGERNLLDYFEILKTSPITSSYQLKK